MRIQLRRDLATVWAEKNPRLASGEPGFEEDTGKLKIGNGAWHWNQLPYIDFSGDPGDISAVLAAHVNSLTPHPVYDDGPSLVLLYENAKV
jgi:hypothetical protein